MTDRRKFTLIEGGSGAENRAGSGGAPGAASDARAGSRTGIGQSGKTLRGSRLGRLGARKSIAAEDPKQAFERYYRESYSLVYNYIFRYTSNRATTEDIVADTFMRAARYFDRFDASRAKFSTWVISIARNCMNSYFRSDRPTSNIDDIAEGLYASDEDPAAQFDADSETNAVSKLLAVLDDETRDLVFMKYYEGKSNKQIAAELSMNASTVSTKLSRAMAQMRKTAAREGW